MAQCPDCATICAHERLIAAAERDLAEKVLERVRKYRPATANGRLIQSDIHQGLCALFNESGIEMERGSNAV